MSHPNTDDIRIDALKELLSPAELLNQLPCDDQAASVIFQARNQAHRILHGMDDRLILIIGPCSIHDPKAALEYAEKLKPLADKYQQELLIIMRVYFEKPRTTVGWKGLINDPHLDNSFRINDGLKIARELLLKINQMGLAAATEFLDVISPQYIADLISWGAIGARTTESQVHRELASGLSCPVGFKNGTDGNIRIAIDAIKASTQPHHFLSVTKSGRSAIVSTKGNEDCHVILRGGKEPNYDAQSIEKTAQTLLSANLSAHIMVDASHANSLKNHENQLPVCEDLAAQISAGDERLIGVMVESNLIAGRQNHHCGQSLEEITYGQSITDACIGWDQTEQICDLLAQAVQARRFKKEMIS
jgi:3-deoxy-7-phosphoheptulonate synthase